MLSQGRCLALLVLLAGPRVAVATEPAIVPEVAAEAQGLGFVVGDGGRLEAETFALPPSVVAGLSGVVPGGRLVVRGFPIAPGERGDVVFERFEPYAREARVWVADERGLYPHPRSSWIHLLGTYRDDPSVRLGLSIDPDGGHGSGLVSTRSGVFGLWELTSDDPAVVRYEVGRSFEDRLGIDTQTACDTADPHPLDLPAAPLAAPPVAMASGSSPSHQATIAFDTDGELLADYGNDTVAAGDAIANLITALNVIYERDLGLRLLQGETILRTNPASDPYVSSSTSDQLSEVGSWWEANQGSIERVWVALLSGKGSWSGNSCSGAGIAWVDQYCNNISYSATQVLRCVPLDAASNTRLIGHEVGHNAGSGHTHCYAPEVDQCYNAQSGCYSGTPSCPDHTAEIAGITPGKGTIMSYCHFSAPAGAACGSNEPYFHPTVIDRIQTSIAAATPSCVEPIGGDLSIVKSDNEDPIGRGAGLSWTVEVTNLGPSVASAVEVSDSLPAGTTFSSTAGCAEDPAGVPTCTLGDIPAGASKAFQVTAFVQPAAPATLINSVSVDSATNDPVSANDMANETTSVVDWPCQTSSLVLTAADSGSAGPFVTEGSISAGAGYQVGVAESIAFRAATGIQLEDGFTVAGTFTAKVDPLLSCP